MDNELDVKKLFYGEKEGDSVIVKLKVNKDSKKEVLKLLHESLSESVDIMYGVKVESMYFDGVDPDEVFQKEREAMINKMESAFEAFKEIKF